MQGTGGRRVVSPRDLTERLSHRGCLTEGSHRGVISPRDLTERWSHQGISPRGLTEGSHRAVVSPRDLTEGLSPESSRVSGPGTALAQVPDLTLRGTAFAQVPYRIIS